MRAKRAAIYCRISDDREGAGLGVKRQEQDCRELALRLGWDVTEVFVDNDLSAYSGKPRPRYKAMLDAVKGGAVEAIVCWHNDRLHRSPRELEDFIDLIAATKAEIATVTAGQYDLSTHSGQMVARILGATARYESDHKSMRIRRKHLELAAAGTGRGGGTRPFGFDADRLTVNATEADVVREAARRVLAGEGLITVARDLNDRGISTSTGGAWSSFSLRRMLLSGRIAGMREHHGKVVAKAVWPAIITEDQHRALRRLLTNPDRRTNHQPRKYLLSGGLLRCGECGAALVSRPRVDKTRAYLCAKGPGFKGCGAVHTLAEPLEELVAKWVFLRLDSDELAEAVDAAETGSVDVEGILDAIAADKQKLLDLAAMWDADELSPAEWRAAREPIQARLKANEERAADVAGTADVRPYVGESDRLRKKWPTMNLDQKRAVIKSVLSYVTVNRAVKGRNTFDRARFVPELINF